MPKVDFSTQTQQPYEVRDSKVHGKGVFATVDIPKGARVAEYLGDRVSHAEADRRYEDKDITDSHTFLFIVDTRTVIDAGVDGNDARFFNHSCNPNCESVVESKRVFIEAIRDIAAGEEMTYDYQIYREEGDPPNIEEIFACRCGYEKCRGTMLWPMETLKKKNSKKKKKKAGSKQVAKRSGTGKATKKAAKKTGGRASAGTSAGRAAAGKSAASRPAAGKSGGARGKGRPLAKKSARRR